MDAQGETRRVTIACQGGGSDTAFTAGVLKSLLRAEEMTRYEVVGLSGTSGGAICALLAWHNLLRDQLLEEGLLSPDGKYKQIVVRVIELSRSRFSRSLGTASKLNREPHFIEDLMSYGETRAEEFLAALAFEDAWTSQDPDAVMGFFAEDAELVSSAPFLSRDTLRGEREIRRFVAEHLARDVRVDLTKKQVSRNGVAWTVKLLGGDGSHDRSVGVAKAQFWEGKIKALRLGDGAGVSNETSMPPGTVNRGSGREAAQRPDST